MSDSRIDNDVVGHHETNTQTMARMLNMLAFYALLVLLAWLPIPLGSNRPWSWGVMEMAIFSILTIWLLGYLLHPKPLPDAVKKVRIPLLLLMLWVGFNFFQAVSIPGALLQLISPTGFDLKQYTLGNVHEGSVSSDRGEALVFALKSAAYVGLFFLVLVLVHRRSRLKTLVWTLFFVGLFEAFYGLMAFVAPYLSFFWNPSPGSLSGTYVNRNHFAGLMELTIPIGIGLIFCRLKSPRHYENWKSRLRGLAQVCLDRRNLLVLSVIVMLGALFLSASRGGALALILALLMVVLFVRFSAGAGAPELRLLPWIALLIIVAASWLGANTLIDRLANSPLDTNRVAVWQSGFGIFKDYPVVGVGGGSFQWVNPLYRGAEIGSGYNKHAHNDYVERLSESGLVGSLILGLAVVLLMVSNLRGYLKRRDRFFRAMLFASVTATTALLLHAFVDFNFQIPANAAYFFVLLAVGVQSSSIVLVRMRNR